MAGKSFRGMPGHIQGVGVSRFYDGSCAATRVETVLVVLVAARATCRKQPRYTFDG